MKSISQTAGMTWSIMVSESAFVTSAIQGICIAIAFAFIISLIATRNVLMTFISILCVSIIVLSVAAVIQLQGWQLGVAESISVVIMIGLSVDYVIHFSTHYMHSPLQTRNEKMQHSFYEMGVSVTSGAITTLFAGLFLFPA